MEDTEDTIDPKLAEKFDALPDEDIAIPLTKGDIALLINSLAELHESYAEFHAAPFLLHNDEGQAGLERIASSERHGRKSYSLFAQLANRLMARYVEEAGR